MLIILLMLIIWIFKTLLRKMFSTFARWSPEIGGVVLKSENIKRKSINDSDEMKLHCRWFFIYKKKEVIK